MAKARIPLDVEEELKEDFKTRLDYFSRSRASLKIVDKDRLKKKTLKNDFRKMKVNQVLRLMMCRILMMDEDEMYSFMEEAVKSSQLYQNYLLQCDEYAEELEKYDFERGNPYIKTIYKNLLLYSMDSIGDDELEEQLDGLNTFIMATHKRKE